MSPSAKKSNVKPTEPPRHSSHTVANTSSSSSSTTSSSAANNTNAGIMDSILQAIGNTPMVRLNHIGKELPCEIVVKCEYLNAGGSVKDRIAREMIENAEAQKIIQPNVTTLIEPTSGNTGIGIALAAAVKGYRCIITLPEKMSKEKVDVLKALGAEIIRTPTEAAYDAPDSHISVAKRLKDELTNAHILDQYSNPANPDAHYRHTAEEILTQCDGKLDMVVIGVGTGGTITGISKRLKEHNPNIQIIGVDPEGSILAQPEQLNDKRRLDPYLVEGIGYDFIPNVLNRSVVDRWYKSNDQDSFLMMRKLIRMEGLLCGGSSGAAVACALQAARSLRAGQRCVVLLPDSVRNYMTKALNDDWMIDHGYVDGDVIKAKSYSSWWATKRVCDLPIINTPLTITSDVRCKDAIALLKQEGFDMVPVLDDDNHVIGVITEGNMTNRILSGRCHPDTPVAEAGVIYKTFHKVTMKDTLTTLANALDHDPFVLVVTEQRCFSMGQNKKRKNGEDGTAQVLTRSVVSGIISRIDLLDYISSGDEEPHE